MGFMKNFWDNFRRTLVFSWKGLGIAAACQTAIGVACRLLWMFLQDESLLPMICMLGILLISVLTEGSIFVMLSALLSSLALNMRRFTTMGAVAFNYRYVASFFVFLLTALVACTVSARMRRLKEVKAEADKEKIRADLLRAISHDLRTPLTTIEGSVGAILDSPESFDRARVLEQLTHVRESSAWLIRMVENLLTVTRMGSSPQDSTLQKTEELAEEVLSDAVHKVRQRFPRSRISVSVPEEPLLVPMDAMLIEQVVINLLENAILHSHATEPIELSAWQEGERAGFRVRDNGVGLDEARCAQFREGHYATMYSKTDSGKFQGMGIGLSVSQSIVLAHGGSVLGRNRLDGPGAEFIFYLPMEDT